MFCTLAAWLINKAGSLFEQPQEYDDPNATISNILSELRSFVSVNNPLVSSCSHVMNFIIDNNINASLLGELSVNIYLYVHTYTIISGFISR